jgi:hypothetical protein
MGQQAKLSAAMLALIAAGASAPVLFDQFISEKKVMRWWPLLILVASGHYATA